MDRLSTDDRVAMDVAQVGGTLPDGGGALGAPAPADPEMIERQWRFVEALAQGLVDTYGPEYRL